MFRRVGLIGPLQATDVSPYMQPTIMQKHIHVTEILRQPSFHCFPSCASSFVSGDYARIHSPCMHASAVKPSKEITFKVTMQLNTTNASTSRRIYLIHRSATSGQHWDGIGRLIFVVWPKSGARGRRMCARMLSIATRSARTQRAELCYQRVSTLARFYRVNAPRIYCTSTCIYQHVCWLIRNSFGMSSWAASLHEKLSRHRLANRAQIVTNMTKNPPLKTIYSNRKIHSAYNSVHRNERKSPNEQNHLNPSITASKFAKWIRTSFLFTHACM